MKFTLEYININIGKRWFCCNGDIFSWSLYHADVQYPFYK